MKNIAIILASGVGERSGLDIPKQFVKIGGKTVLEHTIAIFDAHPQIDEIIIVTNKNYIDEVKEIANLFQKNICVAEVGETRRESSFKGLCQIKEEDAKVLIHDAVRPFLNKKIIDNCLEALDKYDAVDVAVKSADTIIKINEESLIEDIPNRNSLRRGQTPQAFKLNVIRQAHEFAIKEKNINVTDDCGLIIKFNLGKVFVVDGDDYNMKITYPIDVAIADKLFQLKTEDANNEDLRGLSDKVIVIFGGTEGIGKSITEISEQYKARVYSCSRKTGVDISDSISVKKFFDSIVQKEGKIDYVINTAGVLNVGKVYERTFEDIQKEININYFGSINVAKNAYEYLKKSCGSLLLFASSSYTRGRAEYAIYSSTKAAIVNLTQALAEEWSVDNIKINVINPQRTATQMRLQNFGEEPIESLITPEKVAKKSLSVLLSDLNGQVVNVRKDD